MARNFDQSLRDGQVGESVIAQLLRASGYSVLPVYEKEQGDFKGPRLFSPNGERVATDMFVYDGEKALWIEAKHKPIFSFNRKYQRSVTGIDLHHYDHYCQIDKESPFPVWLMFLHRGGIDERGLPSPSGLFGGPIASLKHKESHRDAKPMQGQRHGMVYWAEESLTRFCDVPTLDYAGRVPLRSIPSLAGITRTRTQSIPKAQHDELQRQADDLYGVLAITLDSLWKEQSGK